MFLILYKKRSIHTLINPKFKSFSSKFGRSLSFQFGNSLLGRSLVYEPLFERSKFNRLFSTTFSYTSEFSNNYSGLGEKLFINSTPNEVVFENDKAVLMLPPLKYYKLVFKNITEKGLIVNSHHINNLIKSKDFVVPLLKIIDNLNCGFYKFNIYYFSNLNNYRNCLQMVYTFDLYNKNCLHLIPGSYGYTVLCTSFYLNDNKDRNIFFGRILSSISNGLKEFFENDILNSTMDLNKDTLLVITKLNKDEHDNYN